MGGLINIDKRTILRYDVTLTNLDEEWICPINCRGTLFIVTSVGSTKSLVLGIGLGYYDSSSKGLETLITGGSGISTSGSPNLAFVDMTEDMKLRLRRTAQGYTKIQVVLITPS